MVYRLDSCRKEVIMGYMKYVSIIILLGISGQIFSQSERKMVRQGDNLYLEEKYADAENSALQAENALTTVKPPPVAIGIETWIILFGCIINS